VVEAILKVQGVDLVADPATTRGLFESQGDPSSGIQTVVLSEITLEQLRALRPDLIEALAAGQADELARLRGEVSRHRLEAALLERRRLVRRVLREFELPDPEDDDQWTREIVGGDFLESLLSAPDEAAIRQLVQERAKLLAGARRLVTQAPSGAPRIISREQGRVEGVHESFDARRFAEALRGRQ